MSTEKIRVQKFLANIPLFQGLHEQDLDDIAAETSQIHVPRGTILFRQGDPCTGFHHVMYGQAKLMLRSPAGDEKVVRLISAGDSFGEALMFMGKPYIVTAQVIEDSMLLHIGREGLLALLDARPQLSRKMLASLSQRLHKLMGDVESYSLRSGTQRVIGYLIKGDVPEEVETEILLPASKAVIASRLNLTPEHFSRILRDLSEQELIRVQGRKITVLDSEKLRRHQS